MSYRDSENCFKFKVCTLENTRKFLATIEKVQLNFVKRLIKAQD